jgi:hypothetical protein
MTNAWKQDAVLESYSKQGFFKSENEPMFLHQFFSPTSIPEGMIYEEVRLCLDLLPLRKVQIRVDETVFADLVNGKVTRPAFNKTIAIFLTQTASAFSKRWGSEEQEKLASLYQKLAESEHSKWLYPTIGETFAAYIKNNPNFGTLMEKVTTKKRLKIWIAFFKDNPKKFYTGHSEFQALGRLLESYIHFEV